MNIEELLKEARKIWGNQKLTLEEIVIRQGVAIGDIHRYARDKVEGTPAGESELKKELGNVIFSTIRWCDDLGFKPEECIELAKQAQLKYHQRQIKNDPQRG
jgi:hypothetical protein